MIYKANPFLKKLERVTQINYNPDGFKKYYPEQKDIEKMKFIPQKESFDNCIIIFYEDDDSSSLDNMLWIFKGQVNKKGEPHGCLTLVRKISVPHSDLLETPPETKEPLDEGEREE